MMKHLSRTTCRADRRWLARGEAVARSRTNYCRRSSRASSDRPPSVPPTAADALRLGAHLATEDGHGRYLRNRNLLHDVADCSPTNGSRATPSPSATRPISAPIQSNNADVASSYQRPCNKRAARERRDRRARTVPCQTPAANIGQMYLVMAFVEMQLAEAFCNGVPYSDHQRRRSDILATHDERRGSTRSRWRISTRASRSARPRTRSPSTRGITCSSPRRASSSIRASSPKR